MRIGTSLITISLPEASEREMDFECLVSLHRRLHMFQKVLQSR